MLTRRALPHGLRRHLVEPACAEDWAGLTGRAGRTATHFYCAAPGCAACRFRVRVGAGADRHVAQHVPALHPGPLAGDHLPGQHAEREHVHRGRRPQAVLEQLRRHVRLRPAHGARSRLRPSRLLHLWGAPQEHGPVHVLRARHLLVQCLPMLMGGVPVLGQRAPSSRALSLQCSSGQVGMLPRCSEYGARARA